MLPVKFGTVAESENQIHRKLLVQRAADLEQLLANMDGKVEMGVKALWYEGIVFQEILAEREDIRQLRDSLQGKSPEKTYYERIRLGEMVEEAVRRKRSLDEDMILTALGPHTDQVRANETFGERMIVNASFLVDRAKEPDLDAAIRILDAQQTQRVLFRYVGPVPPYNFVNLIIHWNN